MSARRPVPRLLLLLPFLLASALALLYWRGLTFDPNQAPSRLLAKPLPVFTLPNLFNAEQLLQSRDIQGPALINIWASWCEACRREHAQLLRISRDYGVRVYGIDYQDDSEAARAWLTAQGNPFEWVMLDGASVVAGTLDVFSVPQTYVIDAKGVVRYRHVGEVTQDIWFIMKALL